MKGKEIPISIANEAKDGSPLFDEKVRPWAGRYPSHTVGKLELLMEILSDVIPSCKKHYSEKHEFIELQPVTIFEEGKHY